MLRLSIVSALLSLALTVPALAETPQERGLAIAKQVDAANTGFKGEKSTMTLILVNATGDETTREMDSKVKEKPGGDRSLITFRKPADVDGTRMLTWSHAAKSDDQWLFMSNFNRIKRINAKNKSGSFMASEFAYEDLGSQEVEKYTYTFLREEEVDGKKHWVIERVPTDSDSGYARQVTWIDQERMSGTKIDFYDRKNELLKTMVFTKWNQHGAFWRADEITCSNHQTRKKSILRWSDRSLNIDFSDADFDKSALDE